MGTVESLSRIVGKKQVSTDREVLEAFRSDASFVTGHRPECVVRPRTAEEVLKIVRTANKSGFALVPCSSGGAHTRGDTVPGAERSVVVDLAGMDRIVRVDRRNKVAMIEPGVTFGALREAAAREGLRVAAPLTPRPSKSVVASLLEREPTVLPKYHWDMSDPLCCMEVVFGAGELFRTGAAAGPGSLEEQWAAGQAQKSPMGPSQTDWAKIIQGAQGTLGIVTWVSVKLELLPAVEHGFWVGADSLEALVGFAYGLLRQKLPDVCLLMNRTGMAALLNAPDAAAFPAWLLLYSISGYRHFPQERVAYLEHDIGQIAAAAGLRPRRSLNGVSAQQALARVGGAGGEPDWKTRPAGGYQDIFFLATLDRAPAFVSLLEETAARHGWPAADWGAYIQPVQQGRACHVEFTLRYDPQDAEKARRTEALFRDASRALLEAGAFFSRPYGTWAEMAYGKCPDTVSALKKVKGILDPRGVMNPGKLCFA